MKKKKKKTKKKKNNCLINSNNLFIVKIRFKILIYLNNIYIKLYNKIIH